MPFDAGGTFTRNYSWQADRDAGIKILAQRMDGEFNNYAGGLNQTFLRTGIVPMGGPLNMNSNPIVGVAGGSLVSPGLRFESDTDTGIMQSGPGNLTLVVDGVAMLTATSTGVNIAGTVTSSGGSSLFPDGTIPAPGIAFTPDAATGFSRGPDRSINISTAGARRMNIAAAGVYIDQSLSLAGGINAGQAIGSAVSVSAPAFSIDGSAVFYFNNGNPLLQFDANDYLVYDRTNNVFNYHIAGNLIFQVYSGGVTVPPGLQLFIGDNKNYMQLSAGTNAVWAWDNDGTVFDYMAYDRPNNALTTYIANSPKFQINAGSIVAFIGLEARGGITTAGNINVNGAAVTVKLAPANGGISLNSDSANTGYVAFNRADGVRLGYVGNANGTAGAIAHVNEQGGGHSFGGGGVTMSAGLSVATTIASGGRIYPSNTTGFYLEVSGGNPIMGVGANSYYYFDTTIRQHNLVIDAALTFSMTNTYIRHMGVDLGWRNLIFRKVGSGVCNVGVGDIGRCAEIEGAATGFGIADLGESAIVTLINLTGSPKPINTTGVTMIWAGTGITGSRTLANNGVATVVWYGGAACIISGAGLS